MGLEGIVSKRLTVPYRSGPSASALESAAQRGRVGAAQTGASETEKLVTTLATRCARLPTPTQRRDRGGNPGLERNALSLTKKSIDVDNIMAQPAG
jgi:hypothetical protein